MLNNRFIHVILDTMTQEEKKETNNNTSEHWNIMHFKNFQRCRGVSAHCISCEETFEENGPLKHQKGAGRPSNVRNKINQHDKQKPVCEIASEISQKRGLKVSESTVYRCLKDMLERHCQACPHAI